jgi:hypothetical protein
MAKAQQVVTVGHDAEVFLWDSSVESYITSIGKIGGTKKDPLPVEKSSTGLMVQEDGVTLEFNNRPLEIGEGSVGRFIDQWVDHMYTAQNELSRFVRSKNKNYYVETAPQAEFTDEQLDHPQAKTFGCDPDYLAHQYGAMRTPPTPDDLKNVRAAGGHVHIGYDKENSGIPDFALIQLIEAYVYARYVRQDPQYGENRRGQWYGLPGLYRPKPYGVEYRTPSNFWLHGNCTRFPAECGLFAKALVQDPDLASKLWADTDFGSIRTFIEAGGMTPDAAERVAMLYDVYSRAVATLKAD